MSRTIRLFATGLKQNPVRVSTFRKSFSNGLNALCARSNEGQKQALQVSHRTFSARPFQNIYNLPAPVVGSDLPQIDSSLLTITRTTQPRQKIPKEQLKFGQTLSDHMLTIDWDNKKGWHAPAIVPYGPLQIDPAASVLHYGLECFEGMKAYLDDNNSIRLFRPDKNMERMNKSAHRLLLPCFDPSELMKCINELIKVDRDWIPRGVGYSLYIRPTLISTHPYLGVAASSSSKLYVVLSPVGPYYPTGFNPIKVYAENKYARAWPGGTGAAKIGGNYALTIRPQLEAAAKGCAQVLWLFGPQLTVTEVGTMNQFFFWVRKDGEKELITAPLDGTILPGVTRDSILALARSWKEFEVTERTYSLNEVLDAIKEGRMIESFGSGTAAIVSPVKGVMFEDRDYVIPLNKNDPSAKAGVLTQRFQDVLLDIQYGKTKHEWSVVIPETKK